ETVLALPLTQPLDAVVEGGPLLEEAVVGVRRGRGQLGLWMCPHHRCSPRHGGSACPSAYRMTRSLIRSRTHRKLSSLIEKLSKSGAGLRKSIAYSTPSRTANSTVSMS